MVRFFPFWRRAVPPLPDALRALIPRYVPHHDTLSADEQNQLANLAWSIVVDLRWEAARGFALSDSQRMAIAASAALPVLELGIDSYHDVGTIIVHPTTMTYERTTRGPVAGTVSSGRANTLGEAHFGGPLLLAWDAVEHDAEYPERGSNVVIHEFAHKLDMLDHFGDGTPPLDAADERARWIQVCTAEFTRIRDGQAVWPLRDYAATNPAEFFAVASEGFFCRPVDLAEAMPELYEVLAGYYRQDPVARIARG